MFAGFPHPALADPHPSGYREHELNGPVAPVTEDGITTFTIVDRGCSDLPYGDGRGETDCINGNVKSAIIAKRDAAVGNTYEYRFDVRVDPAIDFPAVVDHEAVRFFEGALIPNCGSPAGRARPSGKASSIW